MLTRGNVNLGFMVSLAILIWAFFLPWIQVESSVFNRITKLVGGEETVVMHSFSGYDIPRMANRKDVRAILDVTKIVFKSTEHAGLKSYAVYVIPAWGILLLWMYIWAERKRRIGNLLVSVLAWGFSGYLAVQLMNQNMAYGIWLSLGAIAMMGVCAFFKVVLTE